MGSILLYNATETVRFLKTFKLYVFQKNRWFFSERNLGFLKQTEDSQFDAEYEWNGEISQNIQNLSFLRKRWVVLKNFEFFKNHWWWQTCCRMQLDLSNFSENSNNWSCLGKRVSFSEKPWIFRKWLEVAFLLLNATKTVRFLKTFKLLAVIKKLNGSSKKIEFFFETAKGMNFAVERNWNCQFSPNVLKNLAFQKK